MADNSNNILKHLQDYKMTPPDDACKKAWEGILLQKEEAADADKKGPFEQLQDYSLPAPSLDFKGLVNGNRPPAKKIPWFSKGVARAAAAILIVLACSVAYFALVKKQQPPQAEYAAIGTLDSNNAAALPDSHLTVAPLNATESAAANALAKQNAGKTAAGKITHENIKGAKLKSNGASNSRNYNTNQLYDNDIFFTLVNYKEFGREKLFLKAMADKTITLNKYSYINISDKMEAMLQEVYLTKKNGRPARKAKKAKKKFDKWRKKDEKYFDRRLEKNPADILDLSDFLMNN